MMDIVVDSNVILDIVTEDNRWFTWSSEVLAQYSETHVLVINPVIYAEVSIGFDRIEDVEAVLSPMLFRRAPIPWEAAFLAGKCFLQYRKKEGSKRSPLPDFFIGAHAAVLGIPLLTRDASRYRTYFPQLKLIAP
ncbi:MAG: type II toxin-antitoxin system VapC family toxin [Deltaproteobacteria bacterium]|nr:type II toxin-antitoxin system VapC family toxin [Deltaproteobacteria bacterium]